jgi:acetylornithine deacetylase
MIGRERLIALTRQLVDIPSITGEEIGVGTFLFDLLAAEGWECRRQVVSEGRFNVLATRGRPRFLLTTHLDTVPPYVASSEDSRFIYGRGSCDAKGIAASMICAASELAVTGRNDVGLLFVVGEESESDGALAAGRVTPPVSFVINGEPTDNDLVTGHKGMVLARLESDGIAAHSAYPERGESAIAKLLDVLARLRQHSFPSDPLLGEALTNIGLIQGGVAANVTAPSAQAVVMIRTVGPAERYLSDLETITQGVRLVVIKTTEPQRMLAVEGFPQKVVGYGTDIPALRVLGQPLLLGPGSIFDAHTEKEKVAKGELNRAVDLYQSLILRLDEWVDQEPGRPR